MDDMDQLAQSVEISTLDEAMMLLLDVLLTFRPSTRRNEAIAMIAQLAALE